MVGQNCSMSSCNADKEVLRLLQVILASPAWHEPRTWTRQCETLVRQHQMGNKTASDVAEADQLAKESNVPSTIAGHEDRAPEVSVTSTSEMIDRWACI